MENKNLEKEKKKYGKTEADKPLRKKEKKKADKPSFIPKGAEC